MAITSSINLDKVSGSVNSLNAGIGQLKKSADTIKTVSLNKIKVKRESIVRDKILSNMREEQVKRRDQESIIEASGIGGAFKRVTSVIGDSTKGFLDRIINFASSILIGWLLYNLPTIITGIGDLITRIKSLYGILTGFVSNITNTFQNFGTLLSAVYQDITHFDFTDQSKRVQNAMDDLNVNLDLMRDQFMEGFDLLKTPLGEGPGEEPIPALNTDYTQPAPTTGTSTAGGGGLPGSQSPEMYRIAAALSTEGSGAQSSVDMMQVVVNRKASGKYGSSYTEILSRPSQFEGVEKKGVGGFKKIQTLQEASKWSGQSEATLLRIIRDIQNPSLQSSAAKYVGGAMEFRAAPQYYLKNGLVPGEMGPDGRFYGSGWRGGAGDNQFLKDPIRDRSRINPAGPASFNLPKPIQAQPSSAASAPGRSTPQATINGGITGSRLLLPANAKGADPFVGATDRFGYSTWRGRQHNGIDIGTSREKGYYFAFLLDGIATVIPNNGGAGNTVVIKSGGIIYKFFHLNKFSIKSGTYKSGTVIGEIGNTGHGTGIHLHYEVHPPGTNGVNPEPYLNLITVGKNLNKATPLSQPAQVSTPKLPPAQLSPRVFQVQTPATQSAQLSPTNTPGQNVPSITQDRKGRQTVVIEDRQQSAPQQVFVGGGSQIQMMPIEDSLNSMIKNQILLELAYT
jgi:murein DD-endopeptidase MepM/ murein hydrolase activator NlpD